MVIGTDGSALAQSLTRLVLRLAAGNAVSRVVVGVGTRLSAPALSVILREREESIAGFFMAGDGGAGADEGKENDGETGGGRGGSSGGIGGGAEDEDSVQSGKKRDEDKFAIQTFMGNGGLADEAFNQIIFKRTRFITKYSILVERLSHLRVKLSDSTIVLGYECGSVCQK